MCGKNTYPIPASDAASCGDVYIYMYICIYKYMIYVHVEAGSDSGWW